MSITRPESLNPLTIAFAQGTTFAGMMYGIGMIAAGTALLPAVGGLGTALMMTELGSGMLLSAVSYCGFKCARTAGKVRKIETEQLDALRKAEKTGIMPDGNPYRLLDAGMERSPHLIDTARIGGVFFGVAGVAGLIGAAMAAGPAVLPLAMTGGAALAVGTATYKSARVAEDALAYAEQKTREASRALRNATPATEWARDPRVLVGTEFTYPPAGHFVNKYLEEQAAQEVALLEDLRGR